MRRLVLGVCAMALANGAALAQAQEQDWSIVLHGGAGHNSTAPHPARCPNLRHPLGNRVAQGRAICFLISSKPGHRKLPRPIARPAFS